MPSDYTISSGLYVATCAAQWAGFGIGISSVTSLKWVDVKPIHYFGLFQTCIYPTEQCSYIGDAAWLNAVRAFMIIMIILGFFGALIFHLSACIQPKKLKKIAVSLFILAGVCGIIAASIFTGQYGTSAVVYGIGYIFSWVSAWDEILTAIFAFLSLKFYERTECR